MSLQEHVKKWIGREADWDGKYGGQCVDLFRFYCKEVLGIPNPKPVVGAKDFYEKYSDDTVLREYFEPIENTPDALPEVGDCIIWGRGVGSGYGHVAIFLQGSLKSFDSFDENWPTLSKCTITHHGYSNVLGWLHPRKEVS